MKGTILKKGVYAAIGSRAMRSFLKHVINNEIKRRLYYMKRENLPSFVEKRYHWIAALIERIILNLDRGFLDKEVMIKAIHAFAGEDFSVDRTERLNEIQEAFREKYGDYPPMFVTLSPTQVCNLRCIGCYACSDQARRSTLPYEMVRRIVTDLHDNMSNRFVTISGGEPFMYREDGRTIFDLFREFSDIYFLVYTNGTMLNKENCRRLAELGNAIPAISVEGWERETDDRRGEGTYRKILKGVEYLKESGVPFGFSSTITTKNADIFLQEDIYDFLFGELGAVYLWMFHMMPIGRAKDTLPLLINSEQRVGLFRLWEKLLEQKHYCIADFWNSASVVDGCIAYGRWNGYFYIDWDGKIMPCVFVPFYEETVHEVYGSGRTLGDALQSPLFRNGRQWQKEYGFGNREKQNILMPCSIRDHFGNFKAYIHCPGTKPQNKEAEEMINDPEIEKTLVRFEKELEQLTEQIWKEEFLQIHAEVVS